MSQDSAGRAAVPFPAVENRGPAAALLARPTRRYARGMTSLLLALLVSAATTDPSTLAPADRARIEQAQRLFADYERRVGAFDRDVIQLFEESAKIEVVNHGTRGDEQNLVFTVAQLRLSIDDAMHKAQKRNDVDRYEEVLFEVLGDDVRIVGRKYCPLKKQRNPFTMLVGPNASGVWRIRQMKEEYWTEGSATEKMLEEAKNHPEGVLPPGSPLPGLKR
jgi:hypothetical protein